MRYGGSLSMADPPLWGAAMCPTVGMDKSSEMSAGCIMAAPGWIIHMKKRENE